MSRLERWEWVLAIELFVITCTTGFCISPEEVVRRKQNQTYTLSYSYQTRTNSQPSSSVIYREVGILPFHTTTCTSLTSPTLPIHHHNPALTIKPLLLTKKTPIHKVYNNPNRTHKKPPLLPLIQREEKNSLTSLSSLLVQKNQEPLPPPY